MSDMIEIKDQLAALFAEFEKTHEEWKTKKKEVVDAKTRNSEVVKAIAKLVAPRKELKYKGTKITIVCRPFKNGSGETYFFRGLSDGDDVIEVG